MTATERQAHRELTQQCKVRLVEMLARNWLRSTPHVHQGWLLKPIRPTLRLIDGGKR